MKYFKKELWMAFNSGRDYQNAHEEWMKNLDEYTKQLKSLEGKLSKRNFNFFANESLHDGKIISINIKDSLAERVKQRKPYKNINSPLTVEIQVINYEEDKVYLLKYASIRKMKFDFPSDSPLFWNIA